MLLDSHDISLPTAAGILLPSDGDFFIVISVSGFLDLTSGSQCESLERNGRGGNISIILSLRCISFIYD